MSSEPKHEDLRAELEKQAAAQKAQRVHMLNMAVSSVANAALGVLNPLSLLIGITSQRFALCVVNTILTQVASSLPVDVPPEAIPPQAVADAAKARELADTLGQHLGASSRLVLLPGGVTGG
jgi:hypothetical protein